MELGIMTATFFPKSWGSRRIHCLNQHRFMQVSLDACALDSPKLQDCPPPASLSIPTGLPRLSFGPGNSCFIALSFQSGTLSSLIKCGVTCIGSTSPRLVDTGAEGTLVIYSFVFSNVTCVSRPVESSRRVLNGAVIPLCWARLMRACWVKSSGGG